MLKARILTALIVAPLALMGLFGLPPREFSGLIMAILAVCGWEWANFCRFEPIPRVVYGVIIAGCFLAFGDYLLVWLALAAIAWSVAIGLILRYPRQSKVWQSSWVLAGVGILVLLPAGSSLIALKAHALGNQWILVLLVLIWSADIGAYFIGRRWGRKKLLPEVSPGKSVAGLIGGLVMAMMVGGALVAYLPAVSLQTDWPFWLAVAASVALISVVGDLTLSMFKRNRGIKDSSRLLPGHGGFLDRLDSLFSAAPLFCGWLVIFGLIG